MAGLPLLSTVLSTLTCLGGAVRVGTKVTSNSDYEEYRLRFGIDRDGSSLSYNERAALFEQRREAIERHNAQPGILWRAGLNKFADATTEEFKALLGHRPARHGRRAAVERQTASSRLPATALLQVQPSMLAEKVDWVDKIGSTVLDQGSCGSCWAVAAAGALNGIATLLGHDIGPVSFEEMVDCVVNTHHCGGTGGCQGATAELAFALATEQGVHLQKEYTSGYMRTGIDGNCQAQNIPTAAFKISGYVRIEEDKVEELKKALNLGPTVVSVDGSNWGMYELGIFNGCGVDATVNHAVLGIGYGKERKHLYWTVRNSWGPLWGEHGFIRILRHEGDAEYCGTDHDNQMGVGCDKDATEVKVCGMCGILADSSYPVLKSTAGDSSQNEQVLSEAAAEVAAQAAGLG